MKEGLNTFRAGDTAGRDLHMGQGKKRPEDTGGCCRHAEST